MLKIQIKNYDEFREIFGTRCSPRGCIQNKVLLAFWKYRFAIDGDGRSSQIRSMQELYNLVMNGLAQHPLANAIETFAIKGDKIKYNIQSARYQVPQGGCIDYNKPGNIKYIDTTHCDRNGNGKLCSMGAGRFLRKLIEEHKPRIPEAVITYCSEELQRLWEGDISSMVSGYELVVDKHFDYIYSRDWLENFNSFGSCMTGKGQWEFYRDCVDASAAYLKKNGKIHARCIIYHDVKTTDGKLHNYAERQYACGGSELLKTLLINKLVDGGYIDLYKVIGAGCRDITRVVEAKTGMLLTDSRMTTTCTLRNGQIRSFLDTFKYFFPAVGILANYHASSGEVHEMDHTTSYYEGSDSILSQD